MGDSLGNLNTIIRQLCFQLRRERGSPSESDGLSAGTVGILTTK